MNIQQPHKEDFMFRLFIILFVVLSIPMAALAEEVCKEDKTLIPRYIAIFEVCSLVPVQIYEQGTIFMPNKEQYFTSAESIEELQLQFKQLKESMKDNNLVKLNIIGAWDLKSTPNIIDLITGKAKAL